MSVTALVLPARAKLNLRLQVLGRRPDGFHEVETLIQAISLHDLLLLERSDRTELVCSGLKVPTGQENLVLRAQALLEEAVGRSLPVRIHLVKRIPPGSGMGGGSSDAAAALLGISRIHGLGNDLDLDPIAATLGSDIPFFLRGGAARASGRGERLTAAAINTAWYALAWPGFPLSTAAVYAAWGRTGGDGLNHLVRPALAAEPRLAAFRDRLGAGWEMTGSGSAFFLACPIREEAERAVVGLDGWTAVARSVA